MKSQTATMVLFAGILVLVIIGGYFLARSSDGAARGVAEAAAEQAPVPSGEQGGTPDAPRVPTNPDLKAGIKALRDQRLDEARELLAKVGDDDPGYLIALLNLGTAHADAGDLEAADRAFRTLLSINPEDANAYVGQGRILHRRGHYAQAEAAALRALELDPANPRARYDVGLYRVAQGSLRRGVEAYRRAMNMHDDPKTVMAALDDLRELHDSKPDFPDAHFALAFFANSMGRQDEEIRELEHYLELDPDGPIADLARGNLHKVRGNGEAEPPEAADPTPVIPALRAVALGMVASVAGLLAFHQIESSDLGWHLVTGRLILESRHVPVRDGLALLSFDRPWLDVHWLAQIILAAAHRAGGFVALQLTTVACALAAVWCALRVAGRGGLATGPALALLALLASFQRLQPRPDLVTLFLPGALLLLLERLVGSSSPGPTLARIAVLTVIWVNLHGSYVLAPMTLLAYLAGSALEPSTRRRWRRLVTTLVTVLAATLINPRGVAVWTLFAPYLQAIRGRATGGAAPSIEEWLPTFSDRAADVQQAGVFYAAVLVLCLFGALLARERFSSARAAVLLLYAGLSVTALRNIAPFAFVGAAISAPWLARPLDSARSRARTAILFVLYSGTVLAAGYWAVDVATNRFYVKRALPGRTAPGLAPHAYPQGACDYVEAAGIPGQAFHNYETGGYYLFRFAPGKLAFCDGRLDLLAPDAFPLYERAVASPETFPEIVRDYRITHVILKYTEDSLRLLPWLERREDWVRVYTDGTGLVYVPRGTEPPPVTPRPPPRHPLDALASRAFAPLATLQTGLPVEELNLGFLSEVVGDPAAALGHWEAALEALPGYRPALERRLRALRKLSRRRPGDPEIARRLAEARAALREGSSQR